MTAWYQVFVSHASCDSWVANQIAGNVRSIDGSRVFIDVADIAGGDNFDSEIREQLVRSDELLVLMTPTALESKNVWMEIGAMWYAQKRIVGLLYGLTVEHVQTDDRMPQGIRQLHLLSINDFDSYVVELETRVGKAGTR